MAQFKSSAREGSFSNNQLQAPETATQETNERNRILRGMQDAQTFAEKSQRIALQAEQQTQSIEQKDRAASSSVIKSDLEANKSYTKQAYERELIKKQNKDKYKIDTFGALIDFSKTAFDITSGIIKQNRELQEKARNQVAFTHNYSHKDLVLAKSVKEGITLAQFQETQLVQKLLKEGKSQEYLNVYFDQLVKGNGYKNFINNSNVLDNTGRQNAGELLALTDKLLKQNVDPNEINRIISVRDAEMRAEVTIDGQTPASEILKVYNKHMSPVLTRTDQLVNQRKTTLLGEMVDANFNSTVIASYNESGVKGAYALAGKSSAPNVMGDIVNAVLTTNPDANKLEEMLSAKFEKGGKVYDLSAYPELAAKVKKAQTDKRQETFKQIALEAQVLQAETDVAMAQKFEELKANGFTDVERQELLAFGDNLNPQRSRNNDVVYTNATISAIMWPRIQERLDGMVANQTLSEALMNEMQIPPDMEGPYRNIAKRLDAMRATSEHKGARSYFENRFKGVIRQTSPTLMIDGNMQSDQVEWYSNANVNKAVKAYGAAVLAGVENPLQVVGDKFSEQIGTELLQPGFVVDRMIMPYVKTMRESAPEALKAQKMVTTLARKTEAQKSNPNTWVEIVGTRGLEQATKELATKGSSEVLRMLGSMSNPPLTMYEVQEKIAEVNPNIEPIEVPTYMEMYKELPAEIRNTLNSNVASKKKKLEALRSSLRQFQQDTGPLPVRSTITGAGVAPEDDTNALVETANELGVNALDLATIIGFETAGSYNPSQWGGEGGKYMGLIQFGESERAKYGVVEGMTFRNQLISVAAFLKDRFAGVGMSTQGATLEDLYTTVLAGNPKANRNSTDSNGTSPISGVQKMGPHREAASRRYGLN